MFTYYVGEHTSFVPCILASGCWYKVMNWITWNVYMLRGGAYFVCSLHSCFRMLERTMKWKCRLHSCTSILSFSPAEARMQGTNEVSSWWKGLSTRQGPIGPCITPSKASYIYLENQSTSPLILHLFLLKQPNNEPLTAGRHIPTMHFWSFMCISCFGPFGKKGPVNAGNDFVLWRSIFPSNSFEVLL